MVSSYSGTQNGKRRDWQMRGIYAYICNMKARCGTSQVLAGLLYAAAVWLLSLLTSVLGIPSWKDGYCDVNNCRNVLLAYDVILCDLWSISKWSTHTLLPQCSKNQALTTKCHLRDGLWKHLVFLQMFPYFLTLYRSLFIHSHTNTHTESPLAQLFYPIQCWKLQYKNSDVMMLAWRRPLESRTLYNHLTTP